MKILAGEVPEISRGGQVDLVNATLEYISDTNRF